MRFNQVRPKKRALRAACFFLCVASFLATDFSAAEQFHVFPLNADGDCDEPFERLANSLKPGDELIVHDGVYSQTCTRRLQVNGTAEQPILIRAADGARPTLTRPVTHNATQNNLEIVDSSFVTIRGLRFFGGSIGVRFMGGSDIVFEGNEVAGTDTSAITINSGDATRLTLRNNHIHHTGQSRVAPVTGEGIYVGCNDAECIVTDSVFAYNRIHDLRATHGGGNDGIEIKPGSGGNVVRGNRIRNTTIGRAFPCIFAYGGGVEPNLIEDNHLAQCGEAIQVVSDAIVRNNTIVDSTIAGIVSAPHVQVGTPKDLVIADNQVSGHPMCLQLDWRDATNVTLTGNRFDCADTTAVRAQGVTAEQLRDNDINGRSNVALD
ncbi:MAG: right-handed parallel beta-helix repeat-containing protein [Gammaproteobacteria bacterium]